jgi:hypothetical protein
MLLRFTIDRTGQTPPSETERRYAILKPLGLYAVVDVRSWWALVSNWRWLLAFALLTLGLIYLGLVTAVHARWSSLPENRVRWIDVALAPVRWEEFRHRRGDTTIAGALAALERREVNQAFFDLSAGVALSPGNLRGRSLLAELIGYWDPERARTLLIEGQDYDPNSSVLIESTFAFFARQQAHADALEYAARLLDSQREPALPPDLRRIVLNARLQTLLTLGREAEALAVAVMLPDEPTTAAGRTTLRLATRLLARAGRHDEALAKLRILFQQEPDAPDLATLEGEIALAAADDTRLTTAIRRLKVVYPESINPLLFAYRAWHLRNRTTLRDAVEADIFTYFAGDNTAMQRFGGLLVELELPEALKRTQNTAVRHGLNAFAFQAQMTDLALRRGDFDHAFRTLQDWEWLLSNVKPEQRGFPEFLRRLTRATIDSGTANTTLLVNHLLTLRGQTNPEHFAYAITTLQRAGKVAAAVEVAALSVRYFPYADRLKSLHREVEAAYAAQNAAKDAAEAAVRSATTTRFSEAETILAEIDAHLASGAYTVVRKQLQDLRLARPAWSIEQEPAVELRRVKLAVYTEEGIDARLVIRRYLGTYRGTEEALNLIAFARSLLERKQVAPARMIQGEIAAARAHVPDVMAALESLGPDERFQALTSSPESALAFLDQLLRQNEPDQVLHQVDQIRQLRPAWGEAAEPALAAREFRARWQLQQKPAALLIFRNLVVRAGPRRVAAFKLVRELIAEGDRTTAIQLAREVNLLLPDDRAALILQQEAEAPVLAPRS